MKRILILLSIFCLCSCHSVQKSVQQSVQDTSWQVFQSDLQHISQHVDSVMTMLNRKTLVYYQQQSSDSVFVKDSCSVKTTYKGDTVFVESEYWHNRYQVLAQQQQSSYTDIMLQSTYRMQSTIDSLMQVYLDSIIAVQRSESNTTTIKKSSPSLINYVAAMGWGAVCLMLLLVVWYTRQSKRLNV